MISQNHIIKKMSGNRLELLLRKNAGKREIGPFIEFLSSTLHIRINESDFLSLETTDTPAQDYYHQLHNTSAENRINYDRLTKAEFDDKISVLMKVLDREKAYLFSKQTEICGTVKIPVIKLLQSYEQLIEYGDILAIYIFPAKYGILIDIYEEKHLGRRVLYQILTWGFTWP